MKLVIRPDSQCPRPGSTSSSIVRGARSGSDSISLVVTNLSRIPIVLREFGAGANVSHTEHAERTEREIGKAGTIALAGLDTAKGTPRLISSVLFSSISAETRASLHPRTAGDRRDINHLAAFMSL